MATFARARELCERLGQPPEYLQVIFWLATASVVRGELPQALEAIAGLPSAAEARGNRPALLNAIRGQAMILMFMGRIVEARETLERAIELFSASEEADRMAARAAGQDAGVSMLVLMAWVLWILGHVDEAVSRMTAALERADAVRHAHTHAYAWYYASVLHALRGEPAIAQGYAERCLAISEQHGFRHWLGLSRAIRGICAAMLDPSGSRLDEVKAALDEYQRAGYQLGITVQFVLLCPALLLRNQPEAALEVIDQGLSIVSHNSERFFEAELYRLKARALLMRGAPDDRGGVFARAGFANGAQPTGAIARASRGNRPGQALDESRQARRSARCPCIHLRPLHGRLRHAGSQGGEDRARPAAMRLRSRLRRIRRYTLTNTDVTESTARVPKRSKMTVCLSVSWLFIPTYRIEKGAFIG